MRAIKFQGKRIDNGEWVYGSLRTDYVTKDGENGECVCYISNQDRYSKDCLFLQVHPETVGQFTGLLDKNGKEIYEGDVIKYSEHDRYLLKPFEAEVIYIKTNACFGYNENGINDFGFENVILHPFSDHDEIETDFLPYVKIIGNIHEK